MSSIPGYTLEDFLAWNFDVVVNDSETNFSLGMAEALGNRPRRPRLTAEQFAPIVELYEEHREKVEERLLDFDEECQSWRDYAGCVFDFIPDELDEKARELLKSENE